MIQYILILIFMGLIWIIMTTWFRDRIKKLWLYTLFPLVIYSIPIIYIASRMNLLTQYLVLTALLIIYSYYTMKLIKKISLKDVLFIPILIIILLIVLIIVTNTTGNGGY
ncbi:MAG: hypothetical protein QW558_04870 [Desulfurococcaceae archaeon]